MLSAEVQVVRAAMGHAATTPEEYMDAYLGVASDLMWQPSKGGFVRTASATPSDRVESIKVRADCGYG
jgi:hypothetical protein